MKTLKKTFLKGFAVGSILLAGLLNSGTSYAADPLKVGFMLPYTGTFADLGNAIERGFMLYINQHGGTVAGRSIDFVKLDDESAPPKATDNVNKLIKSDKVDVIVGTVHSGVVMAMAKAANESGTLLIVPNAGAGAVTGPMCSNYIYRSSFSNMQPGFAMGEAVANAGHKTVVTITWKYGAGDESVAGFTESYTKAGGTIVENLTLPFPEVEFQALLTQIASLKPDAVYTFFAGGGAVKFVKDYKAAGLDKTIPLYGAGFLTEGVLEALGPDAEGIETALHYADGLNTEADNNFRAEYLKAYGVAPDVYSVQGYDAAQILAIGLSAVNGDAKNVDGFSKAVQAATFDSPRGKFTLSKSHNPVQDMYLRKVSGGKNLSIGIASKALSDPSIGCKL